MLRKVPLRFLRVTVIAPSGQAGHRVHTSSSTVFVTSIHSVASLNRIIILFPGSFAVFQLSYINIETSILHFDLVRCMHLVIRIKGRVAFLVRAYSLTLEGAAKQFSSFPSWCPSAPCCYVSPAVLHVLTNTWYKHSGLDADILALFNGALLNIN